LYSGAHDLDITQTNSSFEVFMKIRLEDALPVENELTAKNVEYAMA
jgi:hypothetical protein